MAKQKGDITNYTDLPAMLKVEHISEIMGISKVVAYELVNRPDFPALRIGKRIIIPKDKFLNWIDEEANKIFSEA